MDNDNKLVLEGCRLARAAGARGSELLVERWVETSLRSELGRVHPSTRSEGLEVSLRVWLDQGREGRVVGTSDDLPGLVQQALALAEKAATDGVSGPHDRLVSPLKGLGIADRRYGALTDEDRADVLTTAERAARATDRRVVPGPFWYTDRQTQRAFGNSRGVSMKETLTRYSAGGTVTAAGSDQSVTARIDARSFASIASLPLGANAGAALTERLMRGEALYGSARVLLRPTAVAQLFGYLGRALADSKGPEDLFLRRLESGLDRRLHLLDDGILPGGLRTSSFDARGVRPVPVVLIREGVLAESYVGLKESRKLHRPATGHEQASGELRPRNLLLRNGTRSVNATLTDQDGVCLAVRQLPDLSTHLDLATGELSGPVSGAVLEGTRHVGSVHGASLRANLAEVFNQVVEVCADTDRIGHVDAPAMLVDGIELAP